MSRSIEIIVAEVTDIEARIIARFVGDTTGVFVTGTVRGPFCEKGRTLPAEFTFRSNNTTQVATAEVIVTDPCMWSPELPHLYQIDVEARRGTQVLAEYHGKVGLRRIAPRLPVDLAQE
jgi:hypothetical protein